MTALLPRATRPRPDVVRASPQDRRGDRSQLSRHLERLEPAWRSSSAPWRPRRCPLVLPPSPSDHRGSRPKIDSDGGHSQQHRHRRAGAWTPGSRYFPTWNTPALEIRKTVSPRSQGMVATLSALGNVHRKRGNFDLAFHISSRQPRSASRSARDHEERQPSSATSATCKRTTETSISPFRTTAGSRDPRVRRSQVSLDHDHARQHR